MTSSHQLIQPSFVIKHFSSLQNTSLSLLLFSLAKGSPSSWKHLPPWLQEFCSWYLHTRVLRSAFYLEVQSHSRSSRALQSPRGEPCQPGTGRKLPQKGWRKQREETPACHLWSANNFQPLENLRRVRGHSFFPQCALLCCQPADDESAADGGDASGRGDFSNWGGGEEAASGERGRKRSLYKAAKLKNIRREKCQRERAKFGEFWNCQVHYRSEPRPSQTWNQHSSHGSKSKPRCVHPIVHFLNGWGNFWAPIPQSSHLPRSEIQEKCSQNWGQYRITRQCTECPQQTTKLYYSFCFSNRTKRTKTSPHLPAWLSEM